MNPVASPIIAHRGASASAPENTLGAFRLAAEQGADWLELAAAPRVRAKKSKS